MPHHRHRAVVITGASSGIGRATALRLARRGYALVLTARRQEALEDLATECRGRGATVRVAPADVTNAEAMVELAADTVREFGWLDGWVNNAAVVAYGRTEEVPPEVWHRVVQVNLIGYYHGVRAALPWFREQGGGVLVNVSSMLGKTPSPQQSAYAVSKQGIRALSDCVRQEVRDVRGISVCTVLPGAIDTPMFRSGANFTGHQVQPAGPPIDAERVAAAIERCLRRPRREVVVGASTRLGLAATRLAPVLTERVFGKLVDRAHFTAEPATRTTGNLFAPASAGARVDGGWRGEDGWEPPVGNGRRWLAGAGVTAAAAAGVAAAGVAAVRRAREEG